MTKYLYKVEINLSSKRELDKIKESLDEVISEHLMLVSVLTEEPEKLIKSEIKEIL